MSVLRNKEALIRREIKASDSVLDVGFWGQGVNIDDPHWVHRLLKKTGADVWGLDLAFDAERVSPQDHYVRASAEAFSIGQTFDVIFASEIIEHLSNPGLFLDAARAHLKPGGRLIITTPNCFHLFNMVEKLSKGEPTVNHDHTCYFNLKTLRQLLGKNGWVVDRVCFIYSLGVKHRESLKKRFLNHVYRILGAFTPAFMETLVVITYPTHASAPSDTKDR